MLTKIQVTVVFTKVFIPKKNHFPIERLQYLQDRTCSETKKRTNELNK